MPPVFESSEVILLRVAILLLALHQGNTPGGLRAITSAIVTGGRGANAVGVSIRHHDAGHNASHVVCVELRIEQSARFTDHKSLYVMFLRAPSRKPQGSAFG